MLNTVISVLFGILVIGVILVIIADDGDSGRKLAWLLIIALLPVLGLILYFAFGINYRRHWYFNRQHQRFLDAFKNGSDENLNRLLFGKEDEVKIREEFRPLSVLIGTSPYPRVSDGNFIEIITEGKRKFDLLIRDLNAAKEYMHLEYFHFGNDGSSKFIKDILIRKASEGVKVRFVYENIANFPISSRYYNQMKKAGVEVLSFTNPRAHLLNLITKINYRDHRKIVVIDGKIGYTGGMNISDRYFHLWRDTHLRIEGPAVASLQYVFLDSWITSGGVLDRALIEYFPLSDFKKVSESINHPSANIKEKSLYGKLVQILPDEPNGRWPLIQMSYEWVIDNAKKYIYLQTPYFVPPESLLNSLKSAALRGVDVRLMMPRKTDNFFMRPVNHSYYEECLEAGVRIFIRGGNFIHSKTFVSDDYISSIGTANLDFRSFNINYEVNTYIYDEEAALLNKAIFMEDMEISNELSLEAWDKRQWTRRIFERVLRLFSPLL